MSAIKFTKRDVRRKVEIEMYRHNLRMREIASFCDHKVRWPQFIAQHDFSGTSWIYECGDCAALLAPKRILSADEKGNPSLYTVLAHCVDLESRPFIEPNIRTKYQYISFGVPCSTEPREVLKLLKDSNLRVKQENSLRFMLSKGTPNGKAD